MIEKVFILHHTHVDFGYTDDRTRVCDDLVHMVERVTDLVSKTASQGDSAQFRWIHEVSWPVIEYLRRGGERRDEMFQQMRDGLVELTALYVNPTDLFDRDSYKASLDYACQLADAENLPLTTAMFSDSPGIAWSVPDLLAERGIRYLSTAPDFIMSLPLEVERPFYWEGPEGGRVLTWFTDSRYFWYAEGLLHLKLHADPSEATQHLLDYVAQLTTEGYRWSGLAVHVAIDNAPPLEELTSFVAHFNASKNGVTAALATNRDFFDYMESRHGGQFPVHRGAWPDWWANGNASAAYETACSRRAKVHLNRGAALSSLLETEHDSSLMAQAAECLMMFDEHTWGHNSSVQHPWGLDSRLQWAQKRVFATSALQKAVRLEQELLHRVSRPDRVLVANPAPFDVIGVVRLPAIGRARRPRALHDETSQDLFAGQRVRPNDTAGRAGDYYAIPMTARSVRCLRRGKPCALDTGNSHGFENQFFSFELDEKTGSIFSIHDRLAKRRLDDSVAPWGFAEIVHERIPRGGRRALYDISLGATNPDAKRPRPKFSRKAGHSGARRVRFVKGSVFDALLTAGRLPGVSFRREIRLYHAMPRIDVLLRLDKQVQTDYESLYLSFPFLLATPQVWIENAGAVYRAGTDQLPGSATDWHSVGQYLAVSDSEYSILLVPHDAPLVQVGDINTGKWDSRLELQKPWIYSWIMNNMWFTNFPACQEGVVELSWSLTTMPHSFDRSAVEQFAVAVQSGLAVQDGES